MQYDTNALGLIFLYLAEVNEEETEMKKGRRAEDKTVTLLLAICNFHACTCVLAVTCLFCIVYPCFGVLFICVVTRRRHFERVICALFNVTAIIFFAATLHGSWACAVFKHAGQPNCRSFEICFLIGLQDSRSLYKR